MYFKALKGSRSMWRYCQG